VFGLSAVVIVDSVTYLVAAVLIGLVPVPSHDLEKQPRETPIATSIWPSIWREWLEGLRLIRGDRFLASLFLVMCTSTLAEGMFNPLIIPFVDDVLQGEPVVFGWLITAQGIGGLLGGLAVGAVGGRVHPVRLMTLGLMFGAAIILDMVRVPSIPLALLLIALAGLPLTGWMVGRQTLLQSRVPDRFRGRILGTAGTTSSLLLLTGIALSAALADATGIVLIMTFAGVTWMVAGLLAFLLLRSGIAAAAPATGPRRHADTLDSPLDEDQTGVSQHAEIA
jgi:Na+/melibiose symporter-like transporter